LCDRVADAAIVAIAILRGDDKESVLDVEKRIANKRFNSKFMLLCPCISRHKDSHEFANKNIFDEECAILWQNERVCTRIL
jgi:hypothetical protein